MARILLINPSYRSSYGSAKASIVNPILPTLGLATIAATAMKRGHVVNIFDMSWRPYDFEEIRSQILKFKPDIVGITATTPLMNQLRDISVLIKDISQGILIVGGGAHPSALPNETLGESMLDVICAGEADYSFADICDGKNFASIAGVHYREDEEIRFSGVRPPIENLNDLPMPAWELYELSDYKNISHLLARRPPLAMAEFSRGCVFKCDFCASKITMALGYRKKSPERCAQEVLRMYELGFREFMLADDIFTSDQKWATAVCDAIIDTGVDMAWSCTNGIRVESSDEKLFNTMRRAGCYRVSFGFESGSDEVLKKFGKGGRASVEQGRKAVKMARKEGIDTNAFFLMGLSPDTESTMEETISYARQIPVDMMKFGVAIAFPGTPMFNDYVKKGLIRSFDWDMYFIYTDQALFAHEHLSYDTIKAFMGRAYRRSILFNFGFLLRRLSRGLKTGELFWDIFYGFKFFLMPSVSQTIQSTYYAKERWPEWDFSNLPPKASHFQIARKRANIEARPEVTPEPQTR